MYVEYGRQIGDAHYAGYAEAVIAPWMGRAAPPISALLIQANIAQYRHDFDASRALLQRTLSMDARNAQAWLTLAALDMVQGDYSAAAKDCAQVMTAAELGFGLGCSGNPTSGRPIEAWICSSVPNSPASPPPPAIGPGYRA
jgi:hypothetical protein